MDRSGVFDLIRSMSKAEKRNFKVFAARQGDAAGAKFVALFDCLDSMEEYDEERLLRKCPSLAKEQLPNLKAHLYRQVLVSMRLLGVHHSPQLQLHEQIDFARILFDKGLYPQADRVLVRAADMADRAGDLAGAAAVFGLRRRVGECAGTAGDLRMPKVMSGVMTAAGRFVGLADEALALHLRYADLLPERERDRLLAEAADVFSGRSAEDMTFATRVLFYRARAFVHFVCRNHAAAWRDGLRWLVEFDRRPEMKETYYDIYIRGCAMLAEGCYLARRRDLFARCDLFVRNEAALLDTLNPHAHQLVERLLYLLDADGAILDGDYASGRAAVDRYMLTTGAAYRAGDMNDRAAAACKSALLLLGSGDAEACRRYVADEAVLRDPRVRLDLRCRAALLDLMGVCSSDRRRVRPRAYPAIQAEGISEVQRGIFDRLAAAAAMNPSERNEALRETLCFVETVDRHRCPCRRSCLQELKAWLLGRLGECAGPHY